MFDVSNDKKSNTRMGILIKRTGLPPKRNTWKTRRLLRTYELATIVHNTCQYVKLHFTQPQFSKGHPACPLENWSKTATLSSFYFCASLWKIYGLRRLLAGSLFRIFL